MSDREDAIFRLQAAVLDDDRLSTAAKLTFCRALTVTSLRAGWLYGDPRLPEDEKRRLGCLAIAGYLAVKEEPEGFVSIGLPDAIFAAAARGDE